MCRNNRLRHMLIGLRPRLEDRRFAVAGPAAARPWEQPARISPPAANDPCSHVVHVDELGYVPLDKQNQAQADGRGRCRREGGSGDDQAGIAAYLSTGGTPSTRTGPRWPPHASVGFPTRVAVSPRNGLRC